MIRTVIVCEHQGPTDFTVNATTLGSHVNVKGYSSHTGIQVNYVTAKATPEAGSAASLLEYGAAGLSPTTIRTAIASAGSLEEQAYVLADALPTYGQADWTVIMPYINQGVGAILAKLETSMAVAEENAIVTQNMILNLGAKLDVLTTGQQHLTEEVQRLESEADSGMGQNFSLGSYKDDLPAGLVTKSHEWHHANYPVPISLSSTPLTGDVFLTHHGAEFCVLKEVQSVLGATRVTYSTIPMDAVPKNHRHGPVLGHHIGVLRWYNDTIMAVVDVYGITTGGDQPRGLMYARGMRETLGLAGSLAVANILFYNTMGQDFNTAAALHGRESFTDEMTVTGEVGSDALVRFMNWLASRSIGHTSFMASSDPVIEKLPAVKRDAWFETPILPALAANLGDTGLVDALSAIGKHVGKKNAQWGINQRDLPDILRHLPGSARTLLEQMDSNVIGIVSRTWLKKVGNMTSAAHTGRDKVSIIMRVYVGEEEFFPCLSCGKVYATSGERHLCGELDDAFAHLTECFEGYKYTERVHHLKPVRHEVSRDDGWKRDTLVMRYGDGYIRVSCDSKHILNIPNVRS